MQWLILKSAAAELSLNFKHQMNRWVRIPTEEANGNRFLRLAEQTEKICNKPGYL